MYGARSLSNEELFMLLLKTGTRNISVKEVSLNLLKCCNGISNFKDMTLNKLLSVDGIGKVKAIELLAVIEICRRMNEKVGIGDVINCTKPSVIIHYFNYLFQDSKQEEFYVLYLDNKKKYLDNKRLFLGSINSSVAHPREIFKYAYLLSASYIICIHNHPSGDSTPSREDMLVTENLMRIGMLHAIYLVDHIIIGWDNYYSFYEDGNILGNNEG